MINGLRLIPRDYQLKCKEAIYHGFARGKTRGIIVAPTGAGKTMIASMIAFDYVKRLGKRVLFVVHRDALIGQTIKAMANWGITPGVVAGNYKEDRSRLMQIASFQTLTPDELQNTRRDLSRLLSWYKPDVIIYDECHILNYSSVALDLTPRLKDVEGIEDYRDPWLSIGLTGTPFRLKEDESLGDIYQFMTCAPMPQKLIDDKVLVPVIYYDVPNAGSGKIGVRISYIVENWLKKGQNSKTIAFCPSVPFAKSLTAAFGAIGVKAALVHGGTSYKRRQAIYDEFKSDEPDTILILCSCMALTEGFDATNARCGIFARDTNSIALALQMLGRIVRGHAYPDGSTKKDAIALDCVGMYGVKFPYFEDVQITEASLYESDLKLPGDAPRKKCPEKFGGCGAHIAIGLPFCPYCGFAFTLKRQPYLDPGGEMRQVIRTEQDKIVFYRKWLRIAFEKDKPPEWADHKYLNRFNTYPLEGWRLNAIYSNPTPEQRQAVKDYYKRHSFLNDDPSRWTFKQLSLELGYNGDRNIDEFDPKDLAAFEVNTERVIHTLTDENVITHETEAVRSQSQEAIKHSVTTKIREALQHDKEMQ